MNLDGELFQKTQRFLTLSLSVSRCAFMQIYSFTDGGALSLRLPNFQYLNISRSTFDTCWCLNYNKYESVSHGGAIYANAPSLLVQKTCYINCFADEGAAVYTKETYNGQMNLSIAVGFSDSQNLFQIRNISYTNLNLSKDNTKYSLFFKEPNPFINTYQIITYSYFRDITTQYLGNEYYIYTDCLFTGLTLSNNCSIKYMTRCSFDIFEGWKIDIKINHKDPTPIIYCTKWKLNNYTVITEELPIPSFDLTECDFFIISNKTEKQTITKTERYLQLTGNLIISNCIFKDIGEGSMDSAAIVVRNSDYLKLSQTPYLEVESCTFYNIFSADSPAAINASIFTGNASITKICCMKCIGNEYSVLVLSSNTKSNFNSSSLSTCPEEYYEDVNTGFLIYCLLETQSTIYGLNFTHGNFIKSTSVLCNTRFSYSNYANLSVKDPGDRITMTNSILYHFINVTANSVNFIWVTFGKTIEIDLNDMFFVPDFGNFQKDDYFEFINCVFDHSSVPNNRSKYFYNCKYPTDPNNLSFETIKFSNKLMIKCETPRLKPTVSPVLVASITLPALFALTLAIVFGVYCFYRKHQKVIEFRRDLERRLETDYG